MAGIIVAFTILNVAILCFFYGVFPYSNPLSFESLPTARSAVSLLASESSSNYAQSSSFASTLTSSRRLAPGLPRLPQCSRSDLPMKVINYGNVTKPGPYPNLDQRKRVEASLHLFDVVDAALTEGGICYWLDASSLLGAFHHATPFPYANGIEMAILLSDVQRTVSVRLILS